MDPIFWGSVADWAGAIGTVGAFIYVIVQIKMDKKKNNFDSLYNKIEIMINDLEQSTIVSTDEYTEDANWSEGIGNIVTATADGFDSKMVDLTQSVNDENPELEDYLRILNIVLNEIKKYERKKYISKEDAEFFIELIKIKTKKEKIDQILWNVMFSPSSTSLKENLYGLGLFNEKTKNHFLNHFKKLPIYPEIEGQIKKELTLFDRKL